jgi:hypothetical protein
VEQQDGRAVAGPLALERDRAGTRQLAQDLELRHRRGHRSQYRGPFTGPVFGRFGGHTRARTPQGRPNERLLTNTSAICAVLLTALGWTALE